MTLAIVAVLALLAGLVVGYILGAKSAAARQSLLEQKTREDAAALAGMRADLVKAQADLTDAAGFKSLAIERQASIDKLTAERNEAQRTVVESAEAARKHAARISQLEADLANEQKNLTEKVALLEEARKTLANQFQSLAQEILDQKSKTFAEGSQKELGTLLNPLREQLKEFRERVDKVQTESTTGVAELKTLIGSLGTLNQALTAEAHNLATALRRDTKMQGNWGETILRNILDKSGLQEGIHYTFQQSFTEATEEGEGKRSQTDVVVKLPGGRHLVIDSKVSLNAYQDSVNSDDERERAEAIRRHVASIRSHFTELSNRNYHSLSSLVSPDFVVMFVPIEPAFLQAMQTDEMLWADAYQKRVLLCGPTTVLFVVGIVADLWRQEKQARSVGEVMDMGAKLYVKFAAFINDMDSLGKSLQSANLNFEKAKKKLSLERGNLVDGMEKLRGMGLKPKFSKTSKPIPANWLSASDGDGEIRSLAASEEQDHAEDDNES